MPATDTGWRRHVVYRTERTRTTWKLRFALLLVVMTAVWLTAGWWTAAMGRSLVCQPGRVPSDAILIENFDTDYLIFEHARELRLSGLAQRVLIPMPVEGPTGTPNDVQRGFVEVMARVARLGVFDVVPTGSAEPVALNVARDVRRFVEREQIRSVILVAPLFRSRRSALVYGEILGRAGVRVTCQPARSMHDVETWTRTWHGIQDVLLQWFKLQYYRLYVLPLHGA